MADAALFVPADGGFVPTPLAAGPWRAGSVHGGPVAALLARACEREAGPEPPGELARLTIDLFGSVPAAPLTVTARTLRGGRRIRLVEAAVVAGGQEVARATAWWVRTAELELPARLTDLPPSPPPRQPADSAVVEDQWGGGFNSDGAELRVAVGEWARSGAMFLWGRLQVPVVAGEEPSPLLRVAAVADFGNTSTALSVRRFSYPNVDLTVSLHRPPAGEWVGLDAASTVSPAGVGLSRSTIYDETGPIGAGAQSVFVEALTPT